MGINGHDEGHLTLEEFRRAALNPKVGRQLGTLGLAQHEAEEVFTLMDINKKGSISIDNFIEGCLRVRGQARAKHLLGVQFDVQKAWFKLADQLDNQEDRVAKALNNQQLLQQQSSDLVQQQVQRQRQMQEKQEKQQKMQQEQQKIQQALKQKHLQV